MSKRKASNAAPTGKPTKRPKTANMAIPPPLVFGKSMAFQANTVGKGPEKKNIDVNALTIPLPIGASTWVIAATHLLNPVPQGATENTRVGRKIQMVSFRMNWTVGCQPTSVGASPIRIRVVYDKQPNGAIFAVLDYLNTNDIGSFNNLSNSDRFITLADFFTPTVTQVNAGNYSESGTIHRRIGLETMFTGTTGTIANMTTGSIYVLAAQNAYVTTAGPLCEIDSRIRFIDL